MKKIIALVLALVMVLSLATTAFAAQKKAVVLYTVASVAAKAIQMPAVRLADVLEINKDAIVDSVNENLPVAYRNMSTSLNVLDHALTLGARAAQANLLLTGGATKAAANAVSNLLDDVENEDIDRMAEEVKDFGKSVYDLAASAAKKIEDAVEVESEVVNYILSAKVGDMVAKIINLVSEKANIEDAEQLMLKSSMVERFFGNYMSTAAIRGVNEALGGWNSAVNLTLKEAVTPGVSFPVKDKNNTTTFDPDNSSVGQIVEGVIDAVAVLLKTPDYFADVIEMADISEGDGIYPPYVTIAFAKLLGADISWNK